MSKEVLQSVSLARADAQALRRKARSERDEEKRKGSFDAAVATFEGAVALLRRTLRALRRNQSGYTPEICAILESLSQTYGSLGGTWRDAGDFSRAIELYDQGNEIEEERRRNCDARDSYNLLQRLVVRLLRASTQGGQTSAETLMKHEEFARELQAARSEIERQVAQGRTDSWALADLALVRFLCGENADAAIGDLDARKSVGSFYESAYTVVSALVAEGFGKGEVLGGRLDELQRLLRRKGGMEA